jgi:hypothetical protein
MRWSRDGESKEGHVQIGSSSLLPGHVLRPKGHPTLSLASGVGAVSITLSPMPSHPPNTHPHQHYRRTSTRIGRHTFEMIKPKPMTNFMHRRTSIVHPRAVCSLIQRTLSKNSVDFHKLYCEPDARTEIANTMLIGRVWLEAIPAQLDKRIHSLGGSLLLAAQIYLICIPSLGSREVTKVRAVFQSV